MCGGMCVVCVYVEIDYQGMVEQAPPPWGETSPSHCSYVLVRRVLKDNTSEVRGHASHELKVFNAHSQSLPTLL